MHMLALRFLSIAAALVAVLTYEPQLASDSSHVALATVERTAPGNNTLNNPSIRFVGDIMLGRSVESLMLKHGSGYPFENVAAELRDPDLAIGNFEGVVSPAHEHARPFTFSFSIRNEYLTKLRDVGFDVLSLANNHSDDYGSAALSHTRKLCRALGITCAGTPDRLGSTSVAFNELGDVTVGFIFIHATERFPRAEELDPLLHQLSENSDVQVAYLHWGTEYEFTHNRSQEHFARTLIDGGVDAVIGHHPHVVQDVSLYKGKPIFYSLGNFVFDQYFDDDVRTGLSVLMTIDSSTISYELTPISSLREKSRPDAASASDRQELLERILMDIEHEPGVDVASGTLTVGR